MRFGSPGSNATSSGTSGGVRFSKPPHVGADADVAFVGLDADRALAGDLEEVVVRDAQLDHRLPRVPGVARADDPEVLRQPAAALGVTGRRAGRPARRSGRRGCSTPSRTRPDPASWPVTRSASLAPFSSRNSPSPVPRITVPSLGSTAIDPMYAFAPLLGGAGVCAGASEVGLGVGVGAGVCAASVASSSPPQPEAATSSAARTARRASTVAEGYGGREANCGWVGRLGCRPRRAEHRVWSFARRIEGQIDASNRPRPASPPPYPAAVDVRSGPIQLSRHQRHGPRNPVTHHLERARHTDPLLGHQPQQVVDAAHDHAVDRHDQVLGVQAGRGGR